MGCCTLAVYGFATYCVAELPSPKSQVNGVVEPPGFSIAVAEIVTVCLTGFPLHAPYVTCTLAMRGQ